jgi:hypothetical protein
MATTTLPLIRWQNDRLFYVGTGLFIAIVTFGGFAQSYYLSRWLEPPANAPAVNALLAVHGAVFTAWIALMVVQPALIATNNRKIHRKLGYAGAGVAASMVVFGNLAAIAAMDGGFIGFGDPYAFYAIPFFDINAFAVVVALAVLWRNRAETHKRLILLSNVAILSAAVARIPLAPVQAGAPFTFILFPFVIVLAGALYDKLSRGRVHPVWIWGGLAMLLTKLMVLPVMNSEPWLSFAQFMSKFSLVGS